MIAGPGGLSTLGRFLSTPTGKALLAAMLAGALIGCVVSAWAGLGLVSWISYAFGLAAAATVGILRHRWLTRPKAPF